MSNSGIKSTIFAKADSGATSHYIRMMDAACLKNTKSYKGPAVLLPDAGSIRPSKMGQLSLSSKLSKQAQTATALPMLKSSSLISLRQLCDDDCIVLLNKKNMYAVKEDEVILQGKRNLTDGLWDIPIHKSTINKENYLEPQCHGFPYATPKNNNVKQNIRTEKQKTEKKDFFRVFDGLNKLIDVNECEHLCNKQLKEDTRQYLKVNIQQKLNVILRKDKTKEDLARYHHGSLFSPVQSTLVHAIKNNQLTSFPGLSSQLITKNLPAIIATSKGHLNQERQNIQSTKPEKTYEEQLKIIRNTIKKIKNKMPNDQSVTHGSKLRSGSTTIESYKSRAAKHLLREALEADIFDDAFPKSDEHNIKTNDVMYHVYNSGDGVAYTDLTGKFPYRSSRGNNYIMVAYNYDGNAILAEPVKK